MRKQKGYTLIELLIVSLIIGILAATSIPAYTDYKLRTRYTKGVSISDIARKNIGKYYYYTGQFPINNRAAGLPLPKKITGSGTKSVTIDNGTIYIEFSGENDPAMMGKILTFRPIITIDEPATPIYFACGYSQPSNKNQIAVGKNKTNIDKKHLPSSCR